jgi:hypothetical protein
MAQVTLAKAVLEFFGTGEFGRKVEIAEFRELTKQDREDLRRLLIEEGIDVAPAQGITG